MTESRPDPLTIEQAWEERSERLALLHCVNGHRYKRRRSMHRGYWSVCLGCGRIRHLASVA